MNTAHDGVQGFASGFAPGFEIPLHRSLTEPILMGGAPRTVAITNGTLAAAVGLGLSLIHISEPRDLSTSRMPSSA